MLSETNPEKAVSRCSSDKAQQKEGASDQGQKSVGENRVHDRQKHEQDEGSTNGCCRSSHDGDELRGPPTHSLLPTGRLVAITLCHAVPHTELTTLPREGCDLCQSPTRPCATAIFRRTRADQMSERRGKGTTSRSYRAPGANHVRPLGYIRIGRIAEHTLLWRSRAPAPRPQATENYGRDG